jgi:hypothetical protein
LTLLSAALGSTAIDAGLTYLFELVLRLPMHGLAADEAEQLIEVGNDRYTSANVGLFTQRGEETS